MLIDDVARRPGSQPVKRAQPARASAATVLRKTGTMDVRPAPRRPQLSTAPRPARPATAAQPKQRRRIPRPAIAAAKIMVGASADLAVQPTAETIRPKKRRSMLGVVTSILQYPLIAVVAIGAAYSPVVGQWLIGAYFLLALAMRISSRFSFGAALMLLISIPLFQVLKQSGIADTAAVYAYELLVVGTVQAIIELHLANRRKPSKRHGGATA